MHRESSTAVSLWTTSIAAPQLGQCQLEVVSEEVESGGRSLASTGAMLVIGHEAPVRFRP